MLINFIAADIKLITNPERFSCAPAEVDPRAGPKRSGFVINLTSAAIKLIRQYYCVYTEFIGKATMGHV